MKEPTCSKIITSLCCVSCFSPLDEVSSSTLQCKNCGKTYEFTENGIPVMFSEENKTKYQFVSESSNGKRMEEIYKKRFNLSMAQKLLNEAKEAFSHPIYNPDEYFDKYGQEDKILIVGGGGRERENKGNYHIVIDIGPYQGVDVIASITQLPFPESFFDGIECDAVLEHLDSPGAAIKEMYRVLKSNGWIHTVVPFCFPYHGFPHDYYRFSVDGLKFLFSDFEIVSSGMKTGPAFALFTFIANFLVILNFPSFLRYLIMLILSPVRYLDHLLFKKESSSILANCLYIHCRKP